GVAQAILLQVGRRRGAADQSIDDRYTTRVWIVYLFGRFGSSLFEIRGSSPLRIGLGRQSPNPLHFHGLVHTLDVKKAPSTFIENLRMGHICVLILVLVLILPPLATAKELENRVPIVKTAKGALQLPVFNNGHGSPPFKDDRAGCTRQAG